jgi:Cu+-exporting ATPase
MPQVKDVVCGMTIDSSKAAGQSQHKGTTYYFCSAGCKQKFDADSQQYVSKPK